MEKGIIERAYELAPECSTVDEVRGALRREGYSNVDGHLSGPRIRADLTKLLNKLEPRLSGADDYPCRHAELVSASMVETYAALPGNGP